MLLLLNVQNGYNRPGALFPLKITVTVNLRKPRKSLKNS